MSAVETSSSEAPPTSAELAQLRDAKAGLSGALVELGIRKVLKGRSLARHASKESRERQQQLPICPPNPASGAKRAKLERNSSPIERERIFA